MTFFLLTLYLDILAQVLSWLSALLVGYIVIRIIGGTRKPENINFFPSNSQIGEDILLIRQLWGLVKFVSLLLGKTLRLAVKSIGHWWRGLREEGIFGRGFAKIQHCAVQYQVYFSSLLSRILATLYTHIGLWQDRSVLLLFCSKLGWWKFRDHVRRILYIFSNYFVVHLVASYFLCRQVFQLLCRVRFGTPLRFWVMKVKIIGYFFVLLGNFCYRTITIRLKDSQIPENVELCYPITWSDITTLCETMHHNNGFFLWTQRHHVDAGIIQQMFDYYQLPLYLQANLEQMWLETLSHAPGTASLFQCFKDVLIQEYGPGIEGGLDGLYVEITNHFVRGLYTTVLDELQNDPFYLHRFQFLDFNSLDGQNVYHQCVFNSKQIAQLLGNWEQWLVSLSQKRPYLPVLEQNHEIPWFIKDKASLEHFLLTRSTVGWAEVGGYLYHWYFELFISYAPFFLLWGKAGSSAMGDVVFPFYAIFGKPFYFLPEPVLAIIFWVLMYYYSNYFIKIESGSYFYFPIDVLHEEWYIDFRMTCCFYLNFDPDGDEEYDLLQYIIPWILIVPYIDKRRRVANIQHMYQWPDYRRYLVRVARRRYTNKLSADVYFSAYLDEVSPVMILMDHWNDRSYRPIKKYKDFTNRLVPTTQYDSRLTTTLTVEDDYVLRDYFRNRFVMATGGATDDRLKIMRNMVRNSLVENYLKFRPYFFAGLSRESVSGKKLMHRSRRYFTYFVRKFNRQRFWHYECDFELLRYKFSEKNRRIKSFRDVGFVRTLYWQYRSSDWHQNGLFNVLDIVAGAEYQYMKKWIHNFPNKGPDMARTGLSFDRLSTKQRQRFGTLLGSPFFFGLQSEGQSSLSWAPLFMFYKRTPSGTYMFRNHTMKVQHDVVHEYLQKKNNFFVRDLSLRTTGALFDREMVSMVRPIEVITQKAFRRRPRRHAEDIVAFRRAPSTLRDIHDSLPKLAFLDTNSTNSIDGSFAFFDYLKRQARLRQQFRTVDSYLPSDSEVSRILLTDLFRYSRLPPVYQEYLQENAAFTRSSIFANIPTKTLQVTHLVPLALLKKYESHDQEIATSLAYWYAEASLSKTSWTLEYQVRNRRLGQAPNVLQAVTAKNSSQGLSVLRMYQKGLLHNYAKETIFPVKDTVWTLKKWYLRALKETGKLTSIFLKKERKLKEPSFWNQQRQLQFSQRYSFLPVEGVVTPPLAAYDFTRNAKNGNRWYERIVRHRVSDQWLPESSMALTDDFLQYIRFQNFFLLVKNQRAGVKTTAIQQLLIYYYYGTWLAAAEKSCRTVPVLHKESSAVALQLKYSSYWAQAVTVDYFLDPCQFAYVTSPNIEITPVSVRKLTVDGEDQEKIFLAFLVQLQLFFNKLSPGSFISDKTSRHLVQLLADSQMGLNVGSRGRRGMRGLSSVEFNFLCLQLLQYKKRQNLFLELGQQKLHQSDMEYSSLNRNVLSFFQELKALPPTIWEHLKDIPIILYYRYTLWRYPPHMEFGEHIDAVWRERFSDPGQYFDQVGTLEILEMLLQVLRIPAPGIYELLRYFYEYGVEDRVRLLYKIYHYYKRSVFAPIIITKPITTPTKEITNEGEDASIPEESEERSFWVYMPQGPSVANPGEFMYRFEKVETLPVQYLILNKIFEQDIPELFALPMNRQERGRARRAPWLLWSHKQLLHDIFPEKQRAFAKTLVGQSFARLPLTATQIRQFTWEEELFANLEVTQDRIIDARELHQTGIITRANYWIIKRWVQNYAEKLRTRVGKYRLNEPWYYYRNDLPEEFGDFHDDYLMNFYTESATTVTRFFQKTPRLRPKKAYRKQVKGAARRKRFQRGIFGGNDRTPISEYLNEHSWYANYLVRKRLAFDAIYSQGAPLARGKFALLADRLRIAGPYFPKQGGALVATPYWQNRTFETIKQQLLYEIVQQLCQQHHQIMYSQDNQLLGNHMRISELSPKFIRFSEPAALSNITRVVEKGNSGETASDVYLQFLRSVLQTKMRGRALNLRGKKEAWYIAAWAQIKHLSYFCSRVLKQALLTSSLYLNQEQTFAVGDKVPLLGATHNRNLRVLATFRTLKRFGYSKKAEKRRRVGFSTSFSEHKTFGVCWNEWYSVLQLAGENYLSLGLGEGGSSVNGCENDPQSSFLVDTFLPSKDDWVVRQEATFQEFLDYYETLHFFNPLSFEHKRIGKNKWETAHKVSYLYETFMGTPVTNKLGTVLFEDGNVKRNLRRKQLRKMHRFCRLLLSDMVHQLENDSMDLGFDDTLYDYSVELSEDNGVSGDDTVAIQWGRLGKRRKRYTGRYHATREGLRELYDQTLLVGVYNTMQLSDSPLQLFLQGNQSYAPMDLFGVFCENSLGYQPSDWFDVYDIETNTVFPVKPFLRFQYKDSLLLKRQSGFTRSENIRQNTLTEFSLLNNLEAIMTGYAEMESFVGLEYAVTYHWYTYFGVAPGNILDYLLYSSYWSSNWVHAIYNGAFVNSHLQNLPIYTGITSLSSEDSPITPNVTEGERSSALLPSDLSDLWWLYLHLYLPHQDSNEGPVDTKGPLGDYASLMKMNDWSLWGYGSLSTARSFRTYKQLAFDSDTPIHVPLSQRALNLRTQAHFSQDYIIPEPFFSSKGPRSELDMRYGLVTRHEKVQSRAFSDLFSYRRFGNLVPELTSLEINWSYPNRVLRRSAWMRANSLAARLEYRMETIWPNFVNPHYRAGVEMSQNQYNHNVHGLMWDPAFAPVVRYDRFFSLSHGRVRTLLPTSLDLEFNRRTELYHLSQAGSRVFRPSQMDPRLFSNSIFGARHYLLESLPDSVWMQGRDGRILAPRHDGYIWDYVAKHPEIVNLTDITHSSSETQDILFNYCLQYLYQSMCHEECQDEYFPDSPVPVQTLFGEGYFGLVEDLLKFAAERPKFFEKAKQAKNLDAVLASAGYMTSTCTSAEDTRDTEVGARLQVGAWNHLLLLTHMRQVRLPKPREGVSEDTQILAHPEPEEWETLIGKEARVDHDPRHFINYLSQAFGVGVDLELGEDMEEDLHHSLFEYPPTKSRVELGNQALVVHVEGRLPRKAAIRNIRNSIIEGWVFLSTESEPMPSEDSGLVLDRQVLRYLRKYHRKSYFAGVDYVKQKYVNYYNNYLSLTPRIFEDEIVGNRRVPIHTFKPRIVGLQQVFLYGNLEYSQKLSQGLSHLYTNVLDKHQVTTDYKRKLVDDIVSLKIFNRVAVQETKRNVQVLTLLGGSLGGSNTNSPRDSSASERDLSTPPVISVEAEVMSHGRFRWETLPISSRFPGRFLNPRAGESGSRSGYLP
jgi:hypothetical protein